MKAYKNLHLKTAKSEKKKHINWCSRHQVRHSEFPMYWSCDFPNREKEKCYKCNGNGFVQIGVKETIGCFQCEGKKIRYLPETT